MYPTNVSAVFVCRAHTKQFDKSIANDADSTADRIHGPTARDHYRPCLNTIAY